MKPAFGTDSRYLAKAAFAALGAFTILAGTARAQFSGPEVSPTTLPTPRLTSTTDPTVIDPPARNVVIGPEDLLAVRLYGSAEYEPIVRVSTVGTVALPLVGSLQLSGLTVEEAGSLIAQKLRDAGMYNNPQVTVQITESPNRYITVTGEIHAVIPVLGPRRLYDVIAAASPGRPTQTAATQAEITFSHTVTVLRPGLAEPIVVTISTNPEESAKANIAVFPGDTIVLSRVGAVYVVGAFKVQGAIQLAQNSPLTLIQAASLSGGVGFEGRMNDLRIIRTIGADRKEIRVNISKVLSGKVPDPILQANDIVFLPSDPIKAAIKSGGISTVAGVANILVYAVDH